MTTTLSVELVPLDDLRPDPANPRRIGEDELDALERSLRQFGFVQPVLARREDRTVIGGHQRLVAARRLGLTSVPVTWLDVSVEQARLLGLALNKISGSWDEQLLARLLADLQATPDLDLTLSTTRPRSRFCSSRPRSAITSSRARRSTSPSAVRVPPSSPPSAAAPAATRWRSTRSTSRWPCDAGSVSAESLPCGWSQPDGAPAAPGTRLGSVRPRGS